MSRYAVIGNPIAHSRSPQIHGLFAEATGEDVDYGRLLAPLDGFRSTVADFLASGGRGLNVTVPFKIEAFELAARHTPRAAAAGAVNTLNVDGDGLIGDNTDGVGLVRDIQGRLAYPLADRRVLLLGAGGAARGVVLPLLEAGVESVLILNRSMARAVELAALFNDPRVSAISLTDSVSVQVVVNATSAGLQDAAPQLPAACLAGAELAYEMVYGATPTRFMALAASAGCPRVSDGLGMLVEQAAESFYVWRGVRPDTAPVFDRLRAEVDVSSAR